MRARTLRTAAVIGVTLAFGCQKVDVPKEAPAEKPTAPIKAEAELDRTVLPIPEPAPRSRVGATITSPTWAASSKVA